VSGKHPKDPKRKKCSTWEVPAKVTYRNIPTTKDVATEERYKEGGEISRMMTAPRDALGQLHRTLLVGKKNRTRLAPE